MKKKFFLTVYLSATLCIVAVNALSQNTFVTWSTFDMGFGIPTTSNTVIKSALGQVFIGTSMQANTRLESGFLADTLFKGTLVAVNEYKPLPAVFALQQNYPNPFNPSTAIRFSLPQAEFVSLKVFNTLGREITTLVSEERQAGQYVTEWNATGIASGVYFYRIQSNGFIQTKKLILLR